MFCPECGKKNDDGAAFCGGCGKKLQNTDLNRNVIPKNERKKAAFSVNKLLIAEIGAVLISIVIFAGVYNSRYSAKSVAEKYVKAKYECDWNKVYDTLLVEESGDFMTKQAFVTASVMNYGAIDPSETDITGAKKKSGGLFEAKYTVNYDLMDEPMSENVKLKRKGLTWKVDTQDYLADKYTVLVPSGAKVKVDKIKVPEKMKAAERMPGFDTYEIPKVFGYTHYVEIEGDDFEAAGQSITNYKDMDTDGTDYMVRTGYNQQTIDTVMKQAEADLNEILNAAASNKRFSEVDVFTKMSEKKKEDVISKYDGLRNSDFANGDNNTTVLKYQLTNGEIKGKTTEENGVRLIQVELEGNIHIKFQWTGWDETPSVDETSVTDGYQLRYINEENTWKLYDLSGTAVEFFY